MGATFTTFITFLPPAVTYVRSGQLNGFFVRKQGCKVQLDAFV